LTFTLTNLWFKCDSYRGMPSGIPWCGVRKAPLGAGFWI
jgi:hypothetical protein